MPSEVRELCSLTEKQIVEDGDEGAAGIYSIQEEVASFVTTGIARAIVDLNREEDDRRADGVVKTHTIWKVPVYHEPLSDELVETLLSKYYRTYHRQLTILAKNAKLGVDCHTMAAVGPPVASDAGKQRPLICLGNAEGTCPESWLSRLAKCLENSFQVDVSINSPFKGGHIIRSHAHELPWVQVELSRDPFLSIYQKRLCVLEGLSEWCALLGI
ncbi:MAG: N-formylglutamate amidohydrolase [Candidatus Zixiibacteriota bacterium]|nr:MAG: N-formylglutamate amidohydrolase [candidate division Zixibacteria bacterium]